MDEFEAEGEALGGEIVEQLDMYVDALVEFPLKEAKRDYVLRAVIKDRNHHAAIVRWTQSMDDACPLDFQAGVWMEFECVILNAPQKVTARIVNLNHFADCLENMLKTKVFHDGSGKSTSPVPPVEEKPARPRGTAETPPRYENSSEIDYGFTGVYKHIDGEEYDLVTSTIDAIKFTPAKTKKGDTWDLWMYYQDGNSWECKNERYGIKIFDDFAKSIKRCIGEDEWHKALEADNRMPYLLPATLRIHYAQIPSSKNPAFNWNKYVYAEIEGE